MIEARDARILIYDIETFPLTAYAWGPKWETNLIDIKEWGHMLSFSYRWLGDPEIHCVTLPDFNRTFKRDRRNDERLASRLHDLFSEADIRIAHNGDQFDEKYVNTRFAYHRLPYTGKCFTIDTKKAVKRHWRLPSNALADVAAFFGLGSKTPHTGWQLWRDCDNRDMSAWALMTEYNMQDSVLLTDVYMLLRNGGWLDNHPNLATITGNLEACPKCLAVGTMKKHQQRPLRSSATTVAVQFKCTACNGFSTYTQSVRGHRPTYK